MTAPARPSNTRFSFREAYRVLAAAQKGAARSAPAYSRYVNRRMGRVLAAWAASVGLSPNQVTLVSAALTFTGIGLLAALPPSAWLGLAVCVCLVLGYAFDSADGQVARLTGASSPAGEWLDHVVDATKISALPLALLVGFFRADAAPVVWLLVPLAHAVVGAVLFFGMILTEQLRRAAGVTSRAPSGGRGPDVRALLVIPTDYGVLCLAFLLLGVMPAFLAVYTAIVAATALFTLAASIKWFRDVRALGPRSA
ncbi:CDP-alcohol phosphatidyltransferase family protein [Sanguibacter sp. A247]|uniref:CDP-alcohol phosphatidyltransferase family protein n=1 Tax=unclassified Sanguibacter TaxID=2645534 RepID=UPI003FD793D6